MEQPVTHALLEARLTEERRKTEAMLNDALDSYDKRHRQLVVREVGKLRGPIQHLTTRVEAVLTLQAQVDQAQRDAALALGGFDVFKATLREAVDELKTDGQQRTDHLAALVQAHGLAIGRWQSYERLAVGGLGLLAQLPLLKWLWTALKWVFAIVGGVGLGAGLVAVIFAIWR